MWVILSDKARTHDRQPCRVKASRLSVCGCLGLWMLLAAAVTPGFAATEAVSGARRVEIDKAHQRLRAYEGDSLVLDTRISTGKEGKRTPNGHFTVSARERMHRSRLYDNAPMPFSVQIAGNYFIHGFQSVPRHPASHGCIRVPLKDDQGGNPAETFCNWVAPGTPVDIYGKWEGSP